jgi:hypothetical protein
MAFDADKLQMALREMQQNLPLQIQIAQYMAQVTRARFNAYLKEGFTEHQAIELCKTPMSST